MPRDDRSYSQVMRAYDDEKKFLRKIRHRAFHPDYDRPILFRLVGYLVRLVVIAVIVSAILFVRNRSYFNGKGFSQGVETQLGHYMHAEEGKLEKIYWKGDQAVTSYKAKGGPRAFYKTIELPRIAARGRWRELLLHDNWALRDVELGNATVHLRAGPSMDIPAEPPPEEIRGSSWLQATPDFSQTRFGDIALHNASFFWGPHWTSEGSLTDCSGILKRQLGDWTLTLTQGVFEQNWLKNLKIRPNSPLIVSLKDNQINLSGSNLQLGQGGQVTLEGNISLTETPEFNVKLVMEDVELSDILPWRYHANLDGVAKITLILSGSPNRSDGILFDGLIEMVEAGRLRDIPILRTLSVVTPRIEMSHMPIRTGSRIRFNTRQGLLTVSDIQIRGGGAAKSGIGYKNKSGTVQDFAKLIGSFTYQMDTTELDQELVLEDIKKREVEDEVAVDDPNLDFTGEIKIAMPWELLGEDKDFRQKFFTPDKEEYGWITVPIDGALSDISKAQATQMDQAWAEMLVRRQNPFE